MTTPSTSPRNNPIQYAPIQLPDDEFSRIRKLYELSMTLSGDPVDIFRHIAHMIGELLDVKVVCLSEVRGSELYFLSVYVDGEMYDNAGRCELAITPCATVESSKDFRVYDRVAERFPQAQFLKTHNAFSYCGFPALDNNGNVVAVTCLLDDKAHEFSEEDHFMLRIMGQRIGLEIERQRHIDEQKKARSELLKHKEKLEELVEERTAELCQMQDELIKREKLATLGQLTATVSHELRNPLGTIRSSIFSIGEKLKGKNLGVDKSLDRVSRNITRCDNIISELLDFTKAKKPNLTRIKLRDWLSAVTSELTRPPGLTLETHCYDIEAEFDPDLMRRVVVNLYDNACDALDSQPGKVEISCKAVSNNLHLEVKDNGRGLPEQQLANVFEPLFSTKSFGVGLGLAIVRQIIEQHSGNIDIASQLNQGTTLSITLPLRNNRKSPRRETLENFAC